MWCINMKNILFALLFLSIEAFGQVVSEIDCSNGDCHTTTATITQTAGDANYTALWISNIIGDVSFFTPQGNTPRDSKIYLVNRNANRNLNINLASTIPNSSGGNIDLVSDIFNIIQVNSSGNVGKNGVNSSLLCAQAFKRGDFGAEGISYWNDRDGLDDTRCLAEDIAYLDQKFSCPSGYLENSSGDVNVSRIEKKRKCVSLYNRSQCIRRTYDLNCTFDIIRKKSDNLSYDLKDHAGFYIASPFGSTYDPARYSSIPGGYYRSGRTFTQNIRVFEKDLTRFSTENELCVWAFENQTKFVAFWNTTYDNNGVITPTTTRTYNVPFDDGNQTSFHFPLPDSGLDSRGNPIDYSKARIILKSPNASGFYNDFISRNGEKSLYYAKPQRGFRDCIGLNSSALNDYICNKIPGPAFSMTYNILDEYGVMSQDLTFNIGSSRTRSVQLWKYSAGFGAVVFPCKTGTHSSFDFNGSIISNCNVYLPNTVEGDASYNYFNSGDFLYTVQYNWSVNGSGYHDDSDFRFGEFYLVTSFTDYY